MGLKPPITGGCLCGAVRYEVISDPMMSFVCHCHDCQHTSGATGMSLYAVSRGSLKIVGDPAYYEKTGDSGAKARLAFCPTCGSNLFGFPDIAPELATVSALSLDDPSQFAPDFNIYTRSAQHWDVMDSSIPAYEKLPPRPDA